ncbi:MAG: aminotransferase class I/II-fold pyridoxal phosphate-dependent enzyme [Gemmatimonadetes bacterium]|nr:aminotransferase class I/II-fold pyridoxal phosphate-dependent enzyme [Gemmatimonadota bacterium]
MALAARRGEVPSSSSATRRDAPDAHPCAPALDTPRAPLGRGSPRRLPPGAGARANRAARHSPRTGCPDVPAPAHVGEAAIQALRDGDARYVAVNGIPELRAAIVDDLRTRGVHAHPDQVLVTPSAKTAVFYAILATAEPGSEVLVPDPGFPIYPSAVRFAGATPVGYGVDSRNAPDVGDIEARITPRTRAILLNSPNNPTGGALGLRPWRAWRPSSSGTDWPPSPTTSTRASSTTPRSPRRSRPSRARVSKR